MKRHELRRTRTALSRSLLARRELIEHRIDSGRYRITPLALVLSAIGAGMIVQLTGISSRHVLALGMG